MIAEGRSSERPFCVVFGLVMADEVPSPYT